MCKPADLGLSPGTEVTWRMSTGPTQGRVVKFFPHNGSSQKHRGYYELTRDSAFREDPFFHWACEVALTTRTTHDLW